MQVTPGNHDVDNVTITYDEPPHELVVQKSDIDTSVMVANTTYTLYKYTGQIENPTETDLEATVAGDWKLTTTHATLSTGKCLFSPVAVGAYKIVETTPNVAYQSRAQEGQEAAQYFTVDKTTNIITKQYADYTLKQVRVEKSDADTKVAIAGTEFKLMVYPAAKVADGSVTTELATAQADSAGWVKVSKAYAYDTAGNVVTNDGSAGLTPLSDDTTTLPDGSATFKDLPFGLYEAIEVTPTKGYQSQAQAGNPGGHFFVVDKTANSASAYKDTVEVPFADYTLKQVRVEKSDADTGVAVPDTRFQLYVKSGVTVKDGEVDSSTGGNWVRVSAYYGYDKNGNVALIGSKGNLKPLTDDLETGPDGTCTFEDLPFGYYMALEVTPNTSYQSQEQAGFPSAHYYVVDKTANSSSTVKDTVAAPYQDYTLKSIKVQKTDADTKAAVPDTEFQLYTDVHAQVAEGRVTTRISSAMKENASWERVSAALAYNAAGNVVANDGSAGLTPLTDDLTTGADGTCTFTDLPFGIYKVVEVKSNPAYLLPHECGRKDATYYIVDSQTANAVTAPTADTVIAAYQDKAVSDAVACFSDTVDNSNVAFDGRAYGEPNQVGSQYLQTFFAGRNETNAAVDEFTLTNDLFGAEWGLRVKMLRTYTVEPGLDFDNTFAVLYATNLTAGNPDVKPDYKVDPLADNPANPDIATPAAKTSQISYPAGYRVWEDGLSTLVPHELYASDLNLQPGEYITSIKYVFGAVAEGFYIGHYQTLTGTNPGTIANPAGMIPGEFKDTSSGVTPYGVNPSHDYGTYKSYSEQPQNHSPYEKAPYVDGDHTNGVQVDGGLYTENYTNYVEMYGTKGFWTHDAAGNVNTPIQTVHAEVSKNGDPALTKQATATSPTAFMDTFNLNLTQSNRQVSFGEDGSAEGTYGNLPQTGERLATLLIAAVLAALCAGAALIRVSRKKRKMPAKGNTGRR
jgi:LPXTG-motif cell wall-anchored protein